MHSVLTDTHGKSNSDITIPKNLLLKKKNISVNTVVNARQTTITYKNVSMIRASMLTDSLIGITLAQTKMHIAQMIRDATVEMMLNTRSARYTASREIPVVTLLLIVLSEMSDPVKIMQQTADRKGIAKTR